MYIHDFVLRDHDDEASVMDAVKKLNEVKGIKGLGRYFKQVSVFLTDELLANLTYHDLFCFFLTQVAQSARSGEGGQDDFLGSVDVPVKDLPPQGLDRWYKLDGKFGKPDQTWPCRPEGF